MQAVIAPVRSLLDRFARFLLTPGTPVLQPYNPQRSPLERTIRRVKLLVPCLLLGTIYGFLFALLPLGYFFPFLFPLVLLAVIVLWALPDSGRAPTRALEVCFFLFFAVVVLWPNYLAVAIPGLPWISLRRLIGIVLSFFLLYCLATSSSFRAEIKHVLSAEPWVRKLMVAFVIIQTYTTIFSRSFSASFGLYVHDQVTWTAVFFAGVYVLALPGRIRMFLYMMVAMALGLCVLGLFELRNQSILWADSIPSFLRVGDEAVLKILEANFRDGRYRITTTFSVALCFAEYLALTSPIILHFMMSARKMSLKLFWFAIDIFVLVVAYLTTARLGPVGWIAAHTAYFFLWGLRRWQTRRSDIFGAAMTYLFPALFSIMWVAINTIDFFRIRIFGSGTTQFSNDAREVQFEMAPPVIAANPFGYGAGQAGVTLGYVSPSGFPTIDSYILTIVLCYGVIGFLVYYGMIVIGLVRTAKLSMQPSEGSTEYVLPMCGMFTAWMSTKLVLSQEDNAPLFFIMMAVLVAISHHVRQDVAAPAPAAKALARPPARRRTLAPA